MEGTQQLDGMVGKLLQDRVAVVTGAAAQQGIGRAVAVLFAQHGARVALVDIDQARADAVARSLGGGHVGYGCDITRAEDCARVAEAVRRDLGAARILVNNAGVAGRQSFLDIEPADFERMLRVNVLGSFLMTKAMMPALLETRDASIVFISSTAAQRGGGVFGSSHYVSAKAGMAGLARALAREFAPSGVRVNTVAPNLVRTDSTHEMTPEQRAAIEKTVPMQRSATIWDVAGAALFAASDLSSYVTGSTIDVNGGFHIH